MILYLQRRGHVRILPLSVENGNGELSFVTKGTVVTFYFEPATYTDPEFRHKLASEWPDAWALHITQLQADREYASHPMPASRKSGTRLDQGETKCPGILKF